MPTDLTAHLRTLELALQAPENRANAAWLAEVLHPNFVEFGRSGRVYTKAEIIRLLAAERESRQAGDEVSRGSCHDVRLQVISERAALLTYRSAEVTDDGTLSRETLRSSLWLEDHGTWRLLFHQGTPAAAEPSAPMSKPMPAAEPNDRPGSADSSGDTDLTSFVVTSPAEPMLSQAIARTLDAPPGERVRLFAELVFGIEVFMAAHPEERPWTCRIFTGTDGSSIFRGGVGHSLVIDPAGRLWRARSYEDFATTYRFVGSSCEIDTLCPLYGQMREYLPR